MKDFIKSPALTNILLIGILLTQFISYSNIGEALRKINNELGSIDSNLVSIGVDIEDLRYK